MRYRGENLVEKSVNDGYKEGYRERRLEIASGAVRFGGSETARKILNQGCGMFDTLYFL
jgi:hypothetical protein